MIGLPRALTDNFLTRILEEKKEIVGKCLLCKGTGWKDPNTLKELCVCGKEMDYRYKLAASNIPAKYAKSSFSDFVQQKHAGFKQVLNYSQNLESARREGVGLHVYSPRPGTGKTLLISAVLHEAMRRGYFVWWTSMGQLLDDVSHGYSDDRRREVIEWAMFQTDFLFLDELTKFNSGSDWAESQVNNLIQRRVNDNRPILSTDNNPISKLAEKYKDHLVSRFAGQQIEVSVDIGMDFRVESQKKKLMDKLMGKKEAL